MDLGGLKVSAVTPERRILLGLCRKAVESSEAVRCRLFGLRVATLAGRAASGENIMRSTAFCG